MWIFLVLVLTVKAEESLLVIRGFGIQTSTSSSTYLSTAATRFIPTTQIQDIVIHEAFKGFEVRFYLAVIVEGEPGVLVVFPVSCPLAGIRSVLLGRELTNSRKCCPNEKFWRKCGEALAAVFTMRSHEAPRVISHIFDSKETMEIHLEDLLRRPTFHQKAQSSVNFRLLKVYIASQVSIYMHF